VETLSGYKFKYRNCIQADRYENEVKSNNSVTVEFTTSKNDTNQWNQ